MSWKRLLTWSTKKKSSSSASYHGLDHKLVKSTQTSSIPRFSQVKYVGHFLSSVEKRILLIAGVIATVSCLGAFTMLVSNHIERLPKEGGEYHEAMIGQPKLINPLYAALNDVDTDLTALIYAGLFRFNTEQQIEPYLAESFTVSADQKTYTITLRPYLSWSDGTPLTSDDVIYTFELIQNPEVGSPLLSAFQGVAIDKLDDYRIQFSLKEPFAPFITSLTVGILPFHIWSDIPSSNFQLARQNLQPIGAGPWQFSKLFKNESGQIESYILTRNEKYFEQKPYIKSLKFTFYHEYREAIEAMRTHSEMGLSFIPHSLEEKLNKRNSATYPITLPQYTALFFNQESATNLQDINVRLALSYAIDKNKIVNEALGNYGYAVDSPILEGSLGYHPDIKKIESSIEEANKALDAKWTRIEPEEYFEQQTANYLKESEAEIETFTAANSSTPEIVAEFKDQLKQDIAVSVRKNMDPEQSFYRKSKDLAILEISITTVDTPEYSKTAELISKMWQAIGVKTTVQKINSQQIIREIIKKRNYEVLLYGEVTGYDPDPYPFWHSSQISYPGLNLTGYSNRDADKYLEQARVTTDNTERDTLYKKFQDQLQTDIPAIFLYSPIHTIAMSNKVKGVNLETIFNPADRFTGLTSWYIKTGWQWK